MTITPYSIVEDFESAVAEYTGAPYAVAVDSCTNAIFLSLQWLRHTKQLPYRIGVPKRTYVSIPMQVMHAGARPVFEDIDWQGAYTLRSTHIVDSARRFTWGMYHPGAFMCTSHHHTKILSCGKGGCILTDNGVAAEWLRRARYDGRDPNVPVHMDVIRSPGWRMYMMPEQAARGLANLAHLPVDNLDLPRSDYPDLSNMPVFQEKVVA